MIVDNVIIEHIMEVQYLGILLMSNEWLEKEMDQQVNKVNRIDDSMNNFMWKDKFLSIAAKMKIYKITIRPY